MTLPKSTLASLEKIDEDRARAIVQATSLSLSIEGQSPNAVELLAVSQESAVITIPYCSALARIEGLTLIRILPGRHLVLLEKGLSIPELEVAVLDLLETLEAEDGDRPLVERFIEQLRDLRRSSRAKTQEVILVTL